MINKAISLGEYYIIGNYTLKRKIIQELERFGYEINIGELHNEPYYYIGWGEE